jgi:hyperosmotically inducible periplasmic protein
MTHKIAQSGVLGALLLASAFVAAQTPPPSDPQNSSQTTSPDNTRSNRDPSNRAHSADKQSNAQSDVDLTARIRRSVMDDKSLSTDGHNVKVVAENGSVILSGVVPSNAEKMEIERKAASVAGKDRVTNNIRVASKD